MVFWFAPAPKAGARCWLRVVPKAANVYRFKTFTHLAADFKRARRLLKPADFAAVFKNRRVFWGKSVALHYLLTDNYARLGLVVPKKGLKRAVERNRFKRICREVFRQTELPSADIVLRFHLKKARFLESQKSDLSAELQSLFTRLKRL